MTQFIDGKKIDGGGAPLAIENPSNGERVATVTLATAKDLDDAVSAANRAFPEWAAAAPVERAEALLRLATVLESRAEEIAQIESAQGGKPIRLAREFDVPGSIDNVSFFAGAARHLEGKAAAEYSREHTSMIRREPVGVVGAIAPWNYPLQMAAWKILPAVAAGNTIVLKPAEITPLTSIIFAEAASEAGIPSGVINVLTGTGPEIGAPLLRHPGVDMVSFTGSTRVGLTVQEAASSTAKRVHLELGGKAPFVVHDDADLEAAIRGAVAGNLINAGQDCTAATRAIVHESIHREFVDGVAELYRKVKLGPVDDPETDLGSLISAEQRDKVSGMVDRARSYSDVVVGGKIPGGSLKKGAYYEPTLITGAPQDSEIIREEVFGPVLTVQTFTTDEEAISMANDTKYGLAASVWTKDVHRALAGSRTIRAGCVWVNDHIPMVSEMPHGGYKQSGFGKDMSTYSFEDYTVVKHVMFDITGEARKPWHSTVY